MNLLILALSHGAMYNSRPLIIHRTLLVTKPFGKLSGGEVSFFSCTNAMNIGSLGFRYVKFG